MAVVFRTEVGGVSNTNFTPTKPTGTVTGDLLVLHIGFEKGSDITFSGGMSQWTIPTNGRVNNTTNCGQITAYRIEDGTALTSITNSGSAKLAWTVSRYDGHDATTPFHLMPVGTTGSSGNPDPPNAAPSIADCLALITCANKKAGTGTIPAGYTERFDRANTADGIGWSYGATKQLSGTTAENPAAITASESAEWVASTILITPSGGAPSTQPWSDAFILY